MSKTRRIAALEKAPAPIKKLKLTTRKQKPGLRPGKRFIPISIFIFPDVPEPYLRVGEVLFPGF